MGQTPTTPVPQEVSTELERVVERWRQLPLDRALSYADRVRRLVQTLADRVAVANGIPTSAVPDRGPATLMDQLAVMVHDVSTAAVGHNAPALSETPAATPAAVELAEELASLRRELR